MKILNSWELSIILVFAIGLVLMSVGSAIEQQDKEYNVVNRFNNMYTTLEIKDDGKIDVEHKISSDDIVKAKKSNKPYKIVFEIPICHAYRSSLLKSSFNNLSINVLNDSSSYKCEFSDYYYCYYIILNNESQVDEYNKLLKENNNIIDIKYSLSSREVLAYNQEESIVNIYLKNNIRFKESNIIDISYPSFMNLKNTSGIVNKGNNQIEVNLKSNLKSFKTIKFDDSFVNNSNLRTLKNISNDKIEDLFFIISGIFTFVLIVIVIVAYLEKSVKIVKGKYIRDPKEVISPLLAESIIDGKINAKDLIMTVLVDLIRRKNIELIDNEIITLISLDNINTIEEDILKLIFDPTDSLKKITEMIGKSTEISSISNIFKNSKSDTLNIFTNLERIKDDIRKELFSQKICSSIWNTILKQVRVISCLLILNIVVFYALGTVSVLYLPMIDGVYIFLAYKYDTKKIIEQHKRDANDTVVPLFFLILFGGVLAKIINVNIELLPLIMSLIIIVLNYLIYHLSKTFVFTGKGKQEYIKAVALKNYLKEYSLIEKRDIDGVVTFDEYLSYATAFGISSNITKKFDELMMNTNINLQMLISIVFF